MTNPSEILMFSDDPSSVEKVGSVLKEYGRTLDVRPQADLPLVIAAVREHDERDQAVIVDLDPSPMSTLRELEQIITMQPDTRFIVLCEQLQSGLVMEAMNIGARHYIAKSTIDQELPRVLNRLLGGARAGGGSRGSVITVLSAGGGCGATTLAVNLASELPRNGSEAALLIDMDNAYGTVASYLGLSGTYSLAELLAYDEEERVDPQLVSTTAMKYSEQLHVLINPISVDFADPAPLRYERMEPAIEACRQAYPWVVIDAPRVPIALAARLAHMSRFTLIVGQLSVKDVRAARSIHNALGRHGVTHESIRHVINRYRSKHNRLTIDDARKALGDGEVMLVKNDFGNTIESINLGQPLSQCAPRCGARRDIQSLAEEVATQSGNGHVSAYAAGI